MIFPFLLMLISASQMITSQPSAIKVSNFLPNIMDECVIREHQIADLRTNIGCVALCQVEPHCLLSCQSGRKCILLRATVSPHFKGVEKSESYTPTLGLTCHSSWAESKDVAGKAKLTSSSVNNERSANYATLGVSCPRMFTQYQYHSNHQIRPWLQADLEESFLVDRVVIQTRGLGKNTNRFEQMEVRVGDVGGNGDFSGNEVLGYYEGMAQLDEIVIFKGERPLRGRYVSVQCVASTQSYLIIPQMKIVVI